jgi:hypothetical protein
VDVAIVMTATQQLLTWILLGLLLAWMLTFMLLALRPDGKKGVRPQELVESTGSLPAAAAPLHVLATQSNMHVEHNALPAAHVQHTGLINREVGERGTARIAQ